MEHQFPEAARAAVYQAIFNRRDVRDQFLPVPSDAVKRGATDSGLNSPLTATLHDMQAAMQNEGRFPL